MRRCTVGLGMDDWYEVHISTARYPVVRKDRFCASDVSDFFKQRGKRKKGGERRHSVQRADRFDVKSGRSRFYRERIV